MILLDRRVGSRELFDPLTRFGVRVRLTTLPFGDLRFAGHGPGGLLRIGLERKRVDEILSAVHDTRFRGRQVPGLLRSYDRVYVVVEGLWRPDPASGTLMVRRGSGWVDTTYSGQRAVYSTIDHFLSSLEQKARMTIRRTSGLSETAYVVWSLYTWWQKEWAAHRSCYAVDSVGPDAAILDGQPLVRKIAAQLPGIAWSRSRAVADEFRSVRRMANAGAWAWAKIRVPTSGRTKRVVRIGLKTARRIVQAIAEEKRN